LLALVLALVVHQASAPAPWVVLTRRQGVAQPSAAAQLAAVRGVLVEGGVATPPVGDLTKCQRKLPCLISEAKAKGASVLIAVESARVVDEAVVKVDLLSIDEDGRKVESVVAQGPNATILDVLSTQTRTVMLPAVKRALGLTEVPPVVVAPPPAPLPIVVTTPPPPPPPVSVVEPAPTPATSSTFVRWVPGLVGVAAAGAGVGVFLSAATERERLTAGGLEMNEVRPLVESGKTKEGVGVGLMVGGGAAVLASVIWALAAPKAPATASLVPHATGAALVVGGSF
jgi:hypothetical protein